MIDDFISEFKRNAPAYEAWGGFVASEVIRNIGLKSELKEKLLKIPVQFRIKEEASIRGKIALHNLTDPKKQVRDLIGLRFVVLLSSEVRLFESAIDFSEYWAAEKVRDFGVENLENAEIFDYQSLHYIVTCRKEVDYKGVKIPPGVCCEVQVRTMLQHAYAELTHDNIYKPTQTVPYLAKRLVARSMALMETTDMIFCQTLMELEKENKPRNELYEKLSELYRILIDKDSKKFNEKLNLEIIDFLREKIDIVTCFSSVDKFWELNQGFVERVKDGREKSLLFTQPVVLLLYWFVSINSRFLRKKWPFESMTEDLRKILSDSGVALGDTL